MVSLAGGRPSVLVQIGQTPDHGLGCGRAFEQMPHLLGAVSLAISPTLYQQKSSLKAYHVERGQIEAHHARQGPLDGRTGAKTFLGATTNRCY